MQVEPSGHRLHCSEVHGFAVRCNSRASTLLPVHLVCCSAKWPHLFWRLAVTLLLPRAGLPAEQASWPAARNKA